MQTKLKTILAILSLLGLIACAETKVEKEVTEEAAQQPSRSLHGEVAGKGLDSIENSKSLNKEQKQKLRELHHKIMVDTFSIQDETSRLKGILFETITVLPYNEEKVDAIKKKLVKLNDQKLKNMFQALDELKKIIGFVSQQERLELLREFMREWPLRRTQTIKD